MKPSGWSHASLSVANWLTSLPAVMKPAAHGFYSKGCLSGAIAIPVDGPNWQSMRLSRNRRWGHPELIKIVVDLSEKAKKIGWNGLMVGDISQPRGGPMLSGHASHQLGLDADIWLNPMPNRRLTYKERENTSAVSMLKGRYRVNEKIWTKTHAGLIKAAATFPQVERVLVHPGIKKKLCDTTKGDRSWLRKVRPYWGHHYHMHVRMGCPKGSVGCRRQAATPAGTGCDKSLQWWFDVALKPPKKIKRPKGWKPPKVKRKRQTRMSDLPGACRAVLGAPAPANEKLATLQLAGGRSVVPVLKAVKAVGFGGAVPLPTFRPKN